MPTAWPLRGLRAAFAAALLCAALPSLAGPLHVVTEELPPYNMTSGTDVTGLSTEVVEAVFKEMGIAPRIQAMPWARAYDLALHADNVMIYSITRTPEREALFQWAGPIAPTRWFLFSSEARPVDLASLQEALEKRYQIATVNQDVGEQFLLSHHFEIGQTLQQSNHYALNYEKLKRGHVALWISDELNAAYTARNAGDDAAAVLHRSLELPELEDGGFSAAFSLATPPQTVDAFRAALQRLRSDGRYDAIVHKWLAP
ncbi:substrate-binding periplasmic protein [Pseudomonas sp. Marseille-Q5115]|uniref:substrate-binding periplasmic protein n=1 Tax=Pseudomonas sp. Marseille-Q5115 TaxID=2866593 RepID=UPI001CE49520|nr:transporter substrate-binding domain-containing protein [Pseudomonas sp. Marseille-Q5115]